MKKMRTTMKNVLALQKLSPTVGRLAELPASDENGGGGASPLSVVGCDDGPGPDGSSLSLLLC
jgi:hypothetical protein